MLQGAEELPLSGKIFVVTGGTSMPRDEIVSRIRELGGKVTLGISKSTTFLIAGSEPGPSKMKKASEAGTKIISEEYFEEMTKNYVTHPTEVKREAADGDVSKKRNEDGLGAKWVEKHCPKTTSEMVGNRAAVRELKNALASPGNRPILLVGPSGVGKSLSVYLAAKEENASVVEYNGGDCRKKSEIESIKERSAQMTIGGDLKIDKKKLILLEEIENMGVSDKGGLQEILNLFKAARVPLVMTANDKANQKIRSILNASTVITYQKIEAKPLETFLKTVFKAEAIGIPEHLLHQIAISSGGDARYALNTLEYLCKKKEITAEDIKSVGKHMSTQNIFDVTRNLFQPSLPIQRKYESYFEDPGMALLMVFENYSKGASLGSAAEISDSLSTADVVEKKMLYQGMTELFNLGGYYTAVKPPIRLASQISFTGYLGKLSSRRSKDTGLRRAYAHLCHSGLAGGWSLIYYLHAFAKILGKKSPKEKTCYIDENFFDKEDITVISNVLNEKIKLQGVTFKRAWQ